MTFENKKTKRLYYFSIIYNLIIGILILTSLFYFQPLNLYNSFVIFFFTCFFLQKAFGFLIVLLFYSYTQLRKTKIIYRAAILYIDWIVSYFSILPLELGIVGLIMFGYDPLPLFLALAGGFILLFFYYLKRNPDIHFFKPQKQKK